MTERGTIYHRTIARWGSVTQVEIAKGECGELIAELTRYYTQHRGSLVAVAEEIADVEITLSTLKIIIGEKLAAEAKERKLAKLQDILDCKFHHPHPPITTAEAQIESLERMVDNAHAALTAVLESGVCLLEEEKMVNKGLDNKPQ